MIFAIMAFLKVFGFVGEVEGALMFGREAE